ncbi:hypothetical protein PC128_g20879 [Phytophthora cactorum]|nr:hypothetical protein PC128_g20879 [Phytophthora cactorum]
MQLAGPGIIVAKDQDAAHLEGLARPFASYKEMRTSAAKRLQLQRQPEEEAQAEMTPAAKINERGAASTAEATAKHSQNLAAGGGGGKALYGTPVHPTAADQARVYHCPSIRRKEALCSQYLTGAKKQEAAPSRYDVLADDSDEEGDDEVITGEPAVAEI